jgi:hypothetical protein
MGVLPFTQQSNPFNPSTGSVRMVCHFERREKSVVRLSFSVIPDYDRESSIFFFYLKTWIPASAGMTTKDVLDAVASDFPTLSRLRRVIAPLLAMTEGSVPRILEIPLKVRNISTAISTD